MKENNEPYNYYAGHEVTVEFIADEYWDNWGRLVKVFNKGDIVKATLHHSGRISAESTIYPGIEDAVDNKRVKIL